MKSIIGPVPLGAIRKDLGLKTPKKAPERAIWQHWASVSCGPDPAGAAAALTARLLASLPSTAVMVMPTRALTRGAATYTRTAADTRTDTVGTVSNSALSSANLLHTLKKNFLSNFAT